MENSLLKTSNLSNPSFSIGKIGIFLGAASLSQWVLSDLVHIPGGGLGLMAAGGGIWWLLKFDKGKFDAPVTVRGWIKRCKSVLEQFEGLEDEESHSLSQQKRENSLAKIVDRSGPQEIGFLSTSGVKLPNESQFESAFEGSRPLKFFFSSDLPVQDDSWVMPANVFDKDFLVYFLPLPLRAADLLWLGSISEDQPSWIMVEWEDSINWSEQKKGLEAQLPERWNNRILRWSGTQQDIRSVLSPIRRLLDQPKKNLDLTKQRLLARIHSSWQQDLEKLRREKFQVIQSRSQWLVAGAVFASPLPSTDLLSVAVVNGLMVKEMSEVWSCKMKPELLNAVARQLATVALAQGVVEWSGQSLLGLAKLHGTSWLAAGAIQALSAAYLTRVVGRSMADWMALNNGVTEPDLELIKKQAPQLVANAAEKERVDWVGFLKQGQKWIKEQSNNQNQGAIPIV